MPKNIVVFSDGTGQEGGKSNNTNVYKLFNIIEDRTPNQIAFYDRGLGTGPRGVLGKVTGLGISQNIKDCYEFIFENYQAGDQIFLFGFSRGATTVRSLATFIHLFGVLPKSRPELIRRAYRIYKIRNEGKRDRAARKFVARHHTMWARVHFIGVWDTVAALGVPFKTLNVLLDKVPFFRHRFQDLSLSESVENAYQALAIDEERKTFLPQLWKNDTKQPYLKKHQALKQVWFCGMHSDVGGGYQEQSLSDIALKWMITNASAQGLRIYVGHKVLFNADADGTMHNSRNGIGKLFRRKVRSWNSATHGKPTIHQSVIDRSKNRDNTDDPPYAPWILRDHPDHDVET